MIQEVVLLFSVIINLFLVYQLLYSEKPGSLNQKSKGRKSSQPEKSIDRLDPSQINALQDFDNTINIFNSRIVGLENTNREIKSKLNKVEEDSISLAKAFRALNERIDSKPTPEKVKETENRVHAKYAVRDKKEEQKQSSQSNLGKEYQEDEKPTVVEFDVPKQETIFLPSPFDRNMFSVEDASQNERQESLYVIKLDAKSDQTGTIAILENADFTQALNSPQQFLELVCDYANTYTNTVKRVENVEKGEVKKEGDDWIVTKRMLIKFI
jgi:hypothetical protein